MPDADTSWRTPPDLRRFRDSTRHGERARRFPGFGGGYRGFLVYTSADGTKRPAVALATKTCFVFVLDRATGEPLHPVEERVVPRSDVPGEEAARTQPFPKLRLHDTDARLLRFWDFTEEHRAACRRLMAGVRCEGIFTPPSLEGTMPYPGNPGGTNWGSMAYDRSSRIGYLAVARWPTIVKLMPRREFNTAERRGTLNGVSAQHTEQDGTPYGMARTDVVHNDLRCLEGPWSTLVAVDLDVGEILWERPVGTTPWVDVGKRASEWYSCRRHGNGGGRGSPGQLPVFPRCRRSARSKPISAPSANSS